VDVLGGQLAEASEWPTESSARAGFLPEAGLGRGADVFLRSGGPPTILPSEARSGSAEGRVDAEGAAAPPIDVWTCRISSSVVHVCFLRPPRPKHTVVVL
jgi:hypothetical protein